MSSSDPLLALRHAIASGTVITYLDSLSQPCVSLAEATSVVFSPSLTIPTSAPTRFRKPSSTATDWVARPEEFVSVQVILHVWLTKDLPVGEYLKQMRGVGLGQVSVPDRNALIEWLESKTETHDRLVPVIDASTAGVSSSTSSSFPTGGSSPMKHAGATSSPEKRPYIADVKDIQAVKKIRLGELELRDRITVLRGNKTNDFSSVKTMLQERVKAAKEITKGASQTTTPKSDPKPPVKKSRNLYPIIMISSSPTSLITMYNVRRFLEESTFESPQDAKQRMAAEGNHKVEDVVPVYRTKLVAGKEGGMAEKKIRYLVVDGVEALGKFGTDAWDRVVCVMTTGQTWQFKPYKWQDPTQLFHHVKGIHVVWSNDPPNPRIRDWNVTDLKIDPNRRHVDKSTVANFWVGLDDWIVTNKPWLQTYI